MAGQDLGRVDWMSRLGKWRAIKYVGTKDVAIGDFNTKPEAEDALRRYVDQQSEGGKTMKKEEKESCISVGMQLLRENQSYRAPATTPVIFAVNVRGLVTADGMKIPHSELGMHTQAVDKDVLAWSCTRGTCCVAFSDEAGKCGFVHGLDTEVLSHELLKYTRELWGPSE